MRQHASKQNEIPNNLRPQPNANIPTNRLSSQSVSSTDVPSTATSNQKPSRVKDQRDAKAKRNEWRITKMVLAIFLSFVMCYLPITVTKVADKDVKYPGFHIFGYIMLYLSSCINPIIYVIMNKQYRQAYKTVLLCKPGRLLAFTQAGSSVGGKWSIHFLFRLNLLRNVLICFREMERHRIQLQPQVNFILNPDLMIFIDLNVVVFVYFSRTMVSQVSIAEEASFRNSLTQNSPVRRGMK